MMINRLTLILFTTVFILTNTISQAQDSTKAVNKSHNAENFVTSKWKDKNGSAQSLDEKFGDGTMKATRFLKNTKKIKVVYQLNKLCSDSTCAKPYGIGNIFNHINDLKITHGIKAKNYEFVVIIHGGGWPLVLNNEPENGVEKHATDNPFQSQVEKLVAEPGVKIYFCQNTAHSKKVSLNQMIPGIGFVTAGISAIVDLQMEGYIYVQP
ncbi:DsrE family protein [Paracrocinitomix mangrovi]|uniref:DsrE family protein n=1 Tax=Paracrocinitomix mangrovi TaxID=2862509 RepID=UPI001C8EFEC6|nr:DsrE family protein [Paracrocinitomix mangrovi]UKN03491.1 DsrE family protein [Paracrocinitomix mangrovi]